MIGADDKGVSSPIYTFTKGVIGLAQAAKKNNQAQGKEALEGLWDLTQTLLLDLPQEKEVRERIRDAAAGAMAEEKAILCIPGNAYVSPAVFSGTPGYWVEAWVFVPGEEVTGEADDK